VEATPTTRLVSAAPTHATNPQASPVPTHIRPRTARLIAHRLARPPRIRVTRVLSGRSGTCSPLRSTRPRPTRGAAGARKGATAPRSSRTPCGGSAARWPGRTGRAPARERLQVDRQRHFHRPCARAGVCSRAGRRGAPPAAGRHVHQPGRRARAVLQLQQGAAPRLSSDLSDICHLRIASRQKD
jgi:hypothetical protein